ncbi:MAG TPA: sialidase family protein, partial [Actinopolymorphaceae bacterium]|nr:sialidase family protein [Actinopolymorphaceae bacterium]
PVVAWGPDGSVYLSILPVNLDCQSGVYVTRSTDGGETFGTPVLAHYSDACAVSDDKNWLVIDTFKHSPHFGRIYQFWTPFLSSDPAGQNETGSPQAVRWSDDHGATWSDTTFVSDTDIFTQNSQPMIQPDGSITDAYLNFGADGGDEGPEGNVGHHGGDAAAQATPAAAPVGDNWVARTSHDGGKTWSSEVLITNDAGEGPQGIRCCLPSATADPVTGRLYTAWDSATPDQVKLSESFDGRHWSQPRLVSQSDKPGLDRVNVDVTAYRGEVFVSYGTRDTTVESGRFVQQQVSESHDGTHFSTPLSLGPLSDLNYAAVARGKFPGDYAGSSAVGGRLYIVWCRSSAPDDPTALFHQTLYAAVLRP